MTEFEVDGKTVRIGTQFASGGMIHVDGTHVANYATLSKEFWPDFGGKFRVSQGDNPCFGTKKEMAQAAAVSDWVWK